MRLWLLVLGIVVVAAIGTPAVAQNYPWCAYYGDDFGGENCGFSTYDQCMATVSGIGGMCMRNTQYVAPAAPGLPRAVPGRHFRPRHKRHEHS